MLRYPTICLILLLSTCLTAGCWDRKELSDRAFDLGAGADLSKDGTFLISAQFIIPYKMDTSSSSSQGNSKTNYFVETGRGKTSLIAMQNMQTKMSRTITRGHRRNYFIGESLAKYGIGNLLDSFSRDPGNRIRMDFWVVKENTALNALKVNYPLEKISSNAIFKIHRSIGGIVGVSFIDYVINASAEGSSPTLPTIELVTNGDGEKTYKFYGRAIFNDKDKLVGYIDTAESAYRLWILGNLKFVSILAELPEKGANVGAGLMGFNSKLHSTLLGNNKIRMDIKLTGLGRIIENNSNLDLTNAKNLKRIEEILNKQANEAALQLITKVQKNYQTDIFGFNDAVNRDHPRLWNQIKGQWGEIFPNIEVHIQTHISLKQIGLIGPSLHYKESEIEK